MVKTCNLSSFKNTRPYLIYGLVFLFEVFCPACKPNSHKLGLIYHNNFPIAIQLPDYLFYTGDEAEAKKAIKVILQGSGNNTPILGNVSKIDGAYAFYPMISLTPGLTYRIFKGDQLIGKLEISCDHAIPPAELVFVYPAVDTVPENLLKMYLFFTKPVRTGRSLQYIGLLDQNRDTMRNVFLDLQPELWNQTGSVLTLWLDPGRIKRGLVLNQKLGNPLKKNERYELVVSDQWKDTRGKNIVIKYHKKFFVGERDEKSPDPSVWQLILPKAGTKDVLDCLTHEDLDGQLINDCLSVVDESGEALYGTKQSDGIGRSWKFKPDKLWKPGTYKLRVKAFLEDLAGNNLNRVFDRDITKDKQKDQQYYDRTFVIK